MSVNATRRLAGASAASGVAFTWIALYQAYPIYPPQPGWSLSLAGVLFFISLALIHRIHRGQWPGISLFGFVISQLGSCLWVIGGISPQPGWGLLCAGLIPIGYGAIRARLSLSARLLMPLGVLFLLGEPLKYWLGTRAGGLSVLVAFGTGWLIVAVCLLVDDVRTMQGVFRE